MYKPEERYFRLVGRARTHEVNSVEGRVPKRSRKGKAVRKAIRHGVRLRYLQEPLQPVKVMRVKLSRWLDGYVATVITYPAQDGWYPTFETYSDQPTLHKAYLDVLSKFGVAAVTLQ